MKIEPELLPWVEYIAHEECDSAKMRALIVASLLLSLHDSAGKKVQIKELHGKIVVLNFWATWCGPCRHELPMLVEAEKEWAPKGVTFIALSLDAPKDIPKIPEFLAQYKVTFPYWTGASADELDKFHMGNGVPDTAFVDQDGKIVARVLGEIRREELDERLTWLTGDRKSAAPQPLVNHM